MNKNNLAEAARYNDALAEEAGLSETVKRAGLDIEELTHVADQRALRAVLLESRPNDALVLFKNQPLSRLILTPTEVARMRFYTALYLDGITLGWSARKITHG